MYQQGKTFACTPAQRSLPLVEKKDNIHTNTRTFRSYVHILYSRMHLGDGNNFAFSLFFEKPHDGGGVIFEFLELQTLKPFNLRPCNKL